MIHRIYIDIQEIIERAAAQSANDFRALRVAAGKGADEVYEDLVFMPDNRESVLTQIDFTAKMLRTKLMAYVSYFSSTPDNITFEIVDEDCRVDESLESVIADCILSNILSWWYTLRNTELSQLYAQRASDDADEAVHLLTPKFTTRRCRFF